MKRDDFFYHLPTQHIAQSPKEPRDHSKLLIVEKTNELFQDAHFYDLADMLTKNDVLVLNHTRTLPARLFGEIVLTSGEKKRIEIFLLQSISQYSWECLWPGKYLKIGREIQFFDALWICACTGKVENITPSGREIRFSLWGNDFLEFIHKIGEVPLPHYITKTLKNPDRYQTVYADTLGSVATPTAGLHFTPELIEKLQKKGVIIEKVLLHVWIGTFRNVKVENIQEHQMHAEYITLDDATATRLNEYKKQGKNIIAIGTTTVRVLESCATEDGQLQAAQKYTNIFIYPWYKWKFVDEIITNFHLPYSTLLMLVSAFAGTEKIQKAYQYAIQNTYRFFSFGDAMRITDAKNWKNKKNMIH